MKKINTIKLQSGTVPVPVCNMLTSYCDVLILVQCVSILTFVEQRKKKKNKSATDQSIAHFTKILEKCKNFDVMMMVLRGKDSRFIKIDCLEFMNVYFQSAFSEELMPTNWISLNYYHKHVYYIFQFFQKAYSLIAATIKKRKEREEEKLTTTRLNILIQNSNVFLMIVKFHNASHQHLFILT